MAEQFIGLQMLVKLRSPPGTSLKGTVSEVDVGAGLTLSNVWLLETNQWKPRLTVTVDNIADLTEIQENAAASPISHVPQAPHFLEAAQAPVQHVHPVNQRPQALPTAIPALMPSAATTVPQYPAPADAAAQRPLPKPFLDLAIVNAGRRPSSLTRPGTEMAASASDMSGMSIPSSRRSTIQASATRASRETTPVANVTESTNIVKLEPQAPESTDDDIATEVIEPHISSASRCQRRGGRRQRTRNRRGGPKEQMEEEAVHSNDLSAARQYGSSNGWRQTPILQSSSSFQPYKVLRQKQANENGWASEDVTDVQEAGDFDFEGSLAKFDKHTLFEQMRKDDQINEDDRLVAHNRLPRSKPGTAGGKNLHYSENVLDRSPRTAAAKQAKDSKDFWNSEADDGVLNGGGERLSGRELGSRQSSRKGETKTPATRRSQSRKASAAPAGLTSQSRITSGVSQQTTFKACTGRGRLKEREVPAAAAKVEINRSTQLGNMVASSAATSTQGLYSLGSGRRIDAISPLQMANLENIAVNDIGLTEDMMTENTGRGLAEVTLNALTDPAIQVRQGAAGDAAPNTIVVLAGNNSSGMRAIAAARHLRNKGANMLVCIVGLERGESELLEGLRTQMILYKNLGGRLLLKNELFEYIRKISIPTLTIDTPRSALSSLANPAPITLIVDALIGLTVPFEDLRTHEQATTYELIEWANRNEAFKLSVDLPAGVDAASGKVAIIDGSRLYMKPRYVVAVGAPKRGLLKVLAAGDTDDSNTILGDAPLPDDTVLEWRLFVVDMGLGPAVWKKAGTKIRRGIDFQDKWVLEMKYQGVDDEERN